MNLRAWFDAGSRQVPEVLRSLASNVPEVLDATAPDMPARFAWNTRWTVPGVRPVRWLRQLVETHPELAADWIEKGGLRPSPDEEVVLRLADEFKSSASWVFCLHGNVRDYLFDAHCGHAPLTDIVETYWLQSDLFVQPGTPRPQAIALRYSLSMGIRVQMPGGVGGGTPVPKEITDHLHKYAEAPLEQRVVQDFSFLRRILEENPAFPPTLLTFERPELLFAGRTEDLRTAHWVENVLRWARSVPAAPKHLVVLTADTMDGLNQELRKRVNGILQIEVPRPMRAGRRRFLTAAVAACSQEAKVLLPGTRLGRSVMPTLPFHVDDLEALSEATAGLNCAGIETCLLNILEQGASSPVAAIAYIREQRGELLRAESDGLIELIEPKQGLEAVGGGIGVVRKRLEQIVRAMKADADSPARKLVPMGVLFAGPPGTGKSLTAAALAKECADAGIHYIRMGDFRDMWVGQSERNFARILRLLETFGRVIVFMDEIDQSEGASRNQSERHETSKRIFGKLLEFMAREEHRGNILWIAATNRPGSLDPALLRPGRFDLILPFLPPNAQGCVEILKYHIKEDMRDPALVAQFPAFGEEMSQRGFTGAEISLVVTEAARRAHDEGRARIECADLKTVMADYKGSQKKQTDYQEMVKECQEIIAFHSLAGTRP